MSLRTIMWLSLLVAMVAGSSLTGIWNFDVRMTQQELQQKLEARLPIEVETGQMRWSITAATVTLLEDGRVGIAGKVASTWRGKPVEAAAQGDGVLVYRDGGFYLNDFRSQDIRAGYSKNGEGRNLVDTVDTQAAERFGTTSKAPLRASTVGC